MSKEAATNITRNAPSNENRWASKCFISSFKSPANHNNFSFPFSPLLLITLLMPNSTSLCTLFLLSKIPPNTLYHTPLSFFLKLSPSSCLLSQATSHAPLITPAPPPNLQNRFQEYSPLHELFSHCPFSPLLWFPNGLSKGVTWISKVIPYGKNNPSTNKPQNGGLQRYMINTKNPLILTR